MTDKNTASSDPEALREAEDRTRRRFLAFEREVETLRSRVRILGIGLLVTLMLGGVGAFSQGIPGIQRRTSDVDVLTTKHLILQDAEGVTRGEWRVDDEGNSRLGILDRRERSRLNLTVLSGGSPGMAFFNANGRRRVALALLPDEGAQLLFADAAAVPRTTLGLSPGDAAQLMFVDANGEPRILLGLNEMGLGNFILPEVPEDSITEEIGERQGGL